MTPPPWTPEDEPEPLRLGPGGWARVMLRGLPLGVVVYAGLVMLLTLRLLERPLCGQARPVTPFVTQGVCKAAFAILGMGHRVRGSPMRGVGAIVANHASWLDIFALNAPQRIYFVAKAEVARWIGIGWLARATGTVFIARKGAEALNQTRLFETRVRAGHRLLFFPEGTSTDGLRVLPFKTTLFAAFFADGLAGATRIQPVTLLYRPPRGAEGRFYGWWGTMAFGPHLLKTLGARRQGSVEVIFHPPLAVSDFPDRKTLAAACERAVRAPFAEL
ncbi:MAG: 1-acyl-sn-glycerol-3-phosphate acyltransferase [Alphaproteobacteria bacterium]|nr:1-acyl-sn-glycerol-3-phosphate acyltransferase [Alphaproteobacteria bacterium]